LPTESIRVVGRPVGLGPDVAGHLEDLLEALPLVEALGEPQAGARDGRQGLAPAQQRLERDVAVVGGVHER